MLYFSYCLQIFVSFLCMCLLSLADFEFYYKADNVHAVNMLYDDFKPVVDLVFNNWTALQLAVQHGMGAPGGVQTAQLMSVYVARYCVENIVNVDDLTETLEDLMDEEFDTACQDNSPKEVAQILLTFLALLKAGQHEDLKAQLEALPKREEWLGQPVHKSVPLQCHGNPDDDTTSSSDEYESDSMGSEEPPKAEAAPTQEPEPAPEPMDEDEDPGWSLVRSRKKK